jgi:diketogulonate reductase-like aldo/keto reductase
VDPGLQVEMHPGWRNDKILDFCKRHHIHVTAYSPLGSQATDELHDPTVTQIAEKIRKTPGQVLIRWAIQRGVSAIPKSSSPHRIKENMQVFDWKLAAEDFETLSSFQNQVQLLLLLLQLRNLLDPLLELVSSRHLSLSIICFPSDPLCPSSQNSYKC